VTLSQSSQNGDAGEALTYAFSLINTDGSACANSTFDLASVLPSGWSGVVTPANILLSPGGSVNGTLQVTSSASAFAGSYSVGLQVTDSSSSGHDASATTTYVVNEPILTGDTQAPTIPSGLAASANFKQVDLTWNASSDNVAVAGYFVWRDDSLIADTSGTSYRDTSGAEGIQYDYTVSAYDASNNHSAQSLPVTSGKTVKTNGGGNATDDGTADGGTNENNTGTEKNKGRKTKFLNMLMLMID
jgi:hypothetical protein